MAEITLRADLAELPALADFVDRFAVAEGLPGPVAFQLDLVLEELVTNCIAHGAAGGTIEVGLVRTGDVIEVAVIDEGAPFDPCTAPAPDLEAPLEERSVGGLGVFLVNQFVDEIDYRHEGGRNHLRLRKRLTPPGESNE